MGRRLRKITLVELPFNYRKLNGQQWSFLKMVLFGFELWN